MGKPNKVANPSAVKIEEDKLKLQSRAERFGLLKESAPPPAAATKAAKPNLAKGPFLFDDEAVKKRKERFGAVEVTSPVKKAKAIVKTIPVAVAAEKGVGKKQAAAKGAVKGAVKVVLDPEVAAKRAAKFL